MAIIDALRRILNGEPADATDVDYNFQTLETFVNGVADGTNLDAGAVKLATMAENSVDSPQYVEGSIDEEHFSDSLAGAVIVDGVSSSFPLVDLIYWKIGNIVFFTFIGVGEFATNSANMFTFPDGFRPAPVADRDSVSAPAIFGGTYGIASIYETGLAQFQSASEDGVSLNPRAVSASGFFVAA